MSLMNKKSIGFFSKASVLFLAILFLQIGCVKKQNTERAKSQIVQKTKQTGQGQLLTADLEKKAAELAQLRKETEALLSSLKEKEQNLNKRETHLDSLEAGLQAREEMLAQQTRNFRNMRSATLIMLFAALVLLAIAIILLMKVRASGRKKDEDTEPAQLNVNEEKPAQNDEGVDLNGAPEKESSVAAKAEENAIEEKASALIAEIINGGEKVQKPEKKEKAQEVKPGRKRVSKSTTDAAKKTTTTRRKRVQKPEAGTENKNDA